MKKLITEFKQFALKGNVLDLAVGMMIGSAFGKIVTSLVSDILMPLIAGIFRINDFSALKLLLVDKGSADLNVYLNYGQFIQNVIDFLIIAFSVFMIVKAVNAIYKKPEPAAAAPVKSDETKALEKIIAILEKNEQ